MWKMNGRAFRALAGRGQSRGCAPLESATHDMLFSSASRWRLVFAMATFGFLAFRAQPHIALLNWNDVIAAAMAHGPAQWGLALIATFVSFMAVGRYDATILRLVGSDMSASRARRSGMAAIALSQTLGLGLLTATFVRWQMLPGRDLPFAARLTMLVSVSFMAAWALLAALAVLAFLPPASALHSQLRSAAWVTVCAALTLALANATARTFLSRLFGARLPSLPFQCRILMLTCCDCAAAALALYVFLPSADTLAFLSFLPAFILAMGVGVLSGIPGGVGPFEMLLIMLLPDLPPEHLAASILCYRGVYYALPAVIAAGALLLVNRSLSRSAAPASSQEAVFFSPSDQAHVQSQLKRTAWPRAESMLGVQGMHGLIRNRRGQSWLAAPTRHFLICLFDPASTSSPGSLIRDIASLSRSLRRRPCLYKIGPRTAVAARRAGWVVWPIAQECWLDPSGYNLLGPAKSGLRRKLRQAERAGVTIAHYCPMDPSNPLPHTDLSFLNKVWLDQHRAERGFSVGRYRPDYLEHQHLYVASDAGKPVAWISFHAGRTERTLDLVRHGRGLPDGTMQALIMAAMRDAKADGITRLSLAALPLPGLGLGKTARAAGLPIFRHHPAPGLRQFKAGFAPRQTPLYIAAPSGLVLVGAAIALLRAVHFPAALPAMPRGACKPAPNPAHEHSEKVAFDVS